MPDAIAENDDEDTDKHETKETNIHISTGRKIRL